MDSEEIDPRLWKRVALFAPFLMPLGALAATFLVAGRAMVREAETHAAVVFLVLGGLHAWFFVDISYRVVRGRW